MGWLAVGLELEIDPGSLPEIRYRSIPDHARRRADLALVPEGVTAGQVLAEAKRAGGRCWQVRVVDEYRGKGLPAGARSVAFRLPGARRPNLAR